MATDASLSPQCNALPSFPVVQFRWRRYFYSANFVTFRCERVVFRGASTFLRPNVMIFDVSPTICRRADRYSAVTRYREVRVGPRGSSSVQHGADRISPLFSSRCVGPRYAEASAIALSLPRALVTPLSGLRAERCCVSTTIPAMNPLSVEIFLRQRCATLPRSSVTPLSGLRAERCCVSTRFLR